VNFLTKDHSDFVAVELETDSIWVACKRRSSVNSGAWLRRFDDVTGVEKSCVAASKKGKKVKKNVASL